MPVCAGSTRQHGVERAWRGHREGKEGQAGAEERRVGAPDGAGYVPIGALYLPPYMGTYGIDVDAEVTDVVGTFALGA